MAGLMDTDGRFGQRLRKCREKLGLSKRTLAQRIGLSEETVARAEQSRPIIPEIEQKLAEGVGTTIEYLCAGIEPGQESMYKAVHSVIKKRHVGTKEAEELLQVGRSFFNRLPGQTLDEQAWEEILDKFVSGKFESPDQLSLLGNRPAEDRGAISICWKCNAPIYDADNQFCPNCTRPWNTAT